jgi:transposase
MESWTVIHKIKAGVEKGMSVSELARRLGVDRKTARKYRDLSEAEIRRGRRRTRRRKRSIDGYLEWLKNRVAEYEDDGVVNAESIYRELVQMGYSGSARTVRRCVSGMRARQRRRVYQPFETPPGRQAMVDLGEVRNLRMGNGRATVHFVVMVLSHSRKKYGEWFDRPITTEMFLQFHERAFLALGGVAAEVVYDQTKLAVLRERCGECEFNEDFYGFARFCGFEPYICNKYDPESKGKVESVIRYTKRGFLPGRTFADVWDLQRQWEEWLENVADRKPHETTGRSPNELWREERGCLKALPDGPCRAQPSMERRRVLANGLVKVLGNAYSVPQEQHGGEVFVRITEEKIEFYDLLRRLVWTHWRARGRGKRFIEKSHYERRYSVATEALEREVLEIYRNQALLQALRKRFPRHYREQMRGLIRLERDHTQEALREAALRAVGFGCVSLGGIEKIVRAVEAGKRSIPLVTPNNGNALGANGARVREMSYYAYAARQRQEEQDEEWLL